MKVFFLNLTFHGFCLRLLTHFYSLYVPGPIKDEFNNYELNLNLAYLQNDYLKFELFSIVLL